MLRFIAIILETKRRMIMKFFQKGKWLRIVICALLVLAVISGFWGTFKPMPQGTNYRSPEYRTDDIAFLYDLTYEKNGTRLSEQTIFENIYEIIDDAQEYIICDMFLFNDLYDKQEGVEYISLASDLTDRLIAKKQSNEKIKIVFITDPINTVYGAYETEHMKRLSDAGVNVVVTDLRKLRDSNPIYSAFDRILLRFINTSAFPAYLPNVFASSGSNVRLENYLSLLNFKANHRKTISTEKETLITSANPHDPSSLHSNAAFRISGNFAAEVANSEKNVASLSGADIDLTVRKGNAGQGQYGVTLLTERKIKEELLSQINSLKNGDRLDIHMFFFSDRQVVKSIKKAVKRGADVHLVLDATKDAFGIERNGIPNRQVANELAKAGVNVRWYKTQGEQFSTKMAVFTKGNEISMVGGATNFTRRNLNNLNLEASLLITASKSSELGTDIVQYIEKLNKNIDGIYTVDFEEHREKSWLKWVLYWIQEKTGMSTF